MFPQWSVPSSALSGNNLLRNPNYSKTRPLHTPAHLKLMCKVYMRALKETFAHTRVHTNFFLFWHKFILVTTVVGLLIFRLRKVK